MSLALYLAFPPRLALIPAMLGSQFWRCRVVTEQLEPPCWAVLGWGQGSGESPATLGGTETSQSSQWEGGGAGMGQRAAKPILGCEACAATSVEIVVLPQLV